MSLRQVEKLYKKLLVSARARDGKQKLDPNARSDIFEKIMDDVERLIKQLKRCPPGSDAYGQIDNEIRLLLMKEIQVIIDDYVMSCRNGTLNHWVEMYGDINYYIKNFYLYRDGRGATSAGAEHRYGFYDNEHLL